MLLLASTSFGMPDGVTDIVKRTKYEFSRFKGFGAASSDMSTCCID